MSAPVDVAIFDLLRTDAALATLAPGGIYRDAAPEGVVEASQDDPAECFGTVSVRRAVAHHTFCTAPLGGGGAIPPLDEVHYLVQFVSPSANPQGAQAALDRALAILPGLTVPAYRVACSRPRERLPFVVIDGPIRWETRAALWEVWAEAEGAP